MRQRLTELGQHLAAGLLDPLGAIGGDGKAVGHTRCTTFVGLCLLAVVAALLHDTDVPRRGLLDVAGGLLVVTVAACVRTITTGPHLTQVSPPVLHPEQLR